MVRIFKKQIIYIFLTCLFLININSTCQSFEPVQTVIITKEDLANTKATPEKVSFTPKELHDIEVMEKRHFPRTYPEFTDAQRLKNLEYELLGRIWQFSKQDERIKKLKLASSNIMVSGTALPAALSSKKMAKRATQDNIPRREKDDVGLIDGFLRLINPQVYELHKNHAKKMWEYEAEY
ncbi:hypothetical protein IJ670_00310 [bacterium]|nr:hypothetical protein [bacterium]